MEIYAVKNKINGKLYIGQSRNPNPNYYGSGLLIKRSINKYGIENFEKETIEICLSIDELNEREQYWIKFYNTITPNGYNIATGGNGGDLFTTNPDKEKIREGMSKRCKGKGNPMFGKNHSEETKHQISKNKKGQRSGIATWNKGKKYTEEEIQKLKTIRPMYGSNNPRALAWILVDINGVEHHIVGTLKKFCEEHGLPFLSARYYVNRGIVPPTNNSRAGVLRDNLTGWQIRTTDNEFHD